jgi:hypothetical protein
VYVIEKGDRKWKADAEVSLYWRSGYFLVLSEKGELRWLKHPEQFKEFAVSRN